MPSFSLSLCVVKCIGVLCVVIFCSICNNYFSLYGACYWNVPHKKYYSKKQKQKQNKKKQLMLTLLQHTTFSLMFQCVPSYINVLFVAAGQCTTNTLALTGACYWRLSSKKSFWDALDDCESQGGTIAIPYRQEIIEHWNSQGGYVAIFVR